jgi:dimethylargininase
MKFTNAIVRKPGKTMTKGLTSANLGLPIYQKAIKQHIAYVNALKNCGLEVLELEADEHFPDSTFVEDTALLTPSCAIITHPGAATRKGEIVEIKKSIRKYYSTIEEIMQPGTVEAGDIMMVGTHFYIGISERTNLTGAEQLIRILNKYGMTGAVVHLEKVLHLKTGLSYLENNILVASGEFLTNAEFKKYELIEVPENESAAANCIWVNDTVLLPKGYPVTKQKIKGTGYKIIELDISEFAKLDGGLSCLSLRF